MCICGRLGGGGWGSSAASEFDLSVLQEILAGGLGEFKTGPFL